MIPCVVYSLVVPPFVAWWSETARGKPFTVLQGFQRWFAPGWPTTYVLPTGPPWFLWMLWWFNVAYVVLFHIVALVQKLMAKKQGGEQGTGAADAERLPVTRRLRAREFSLKECLMWGSIFFAACFTLMYSTRVLDFMVWKLKPAQFFTVSCVGYNHCRQCGIPNHSILISWQQYVQISCDIEREALDLHREPSRFRLGSWGIALNSGCAFAGCLLGNWAGWIRLGPLGAIGVAGLQGFTEIKCGRKSWPRKANMLNKPEDRQARLVGLHCQQYDG